MCMFFKSLYLEVEFLSYKIHLYIKNAFCGHSMCSGPAYMFPQNIFMFICSVNLEVFLVIKQLKTNIFGFRAPHLMSSVLSDTKIKHGTCRVPISQGKITIL